LLLIRNEVSKTQQAQLKPHVTTVEFGTKLTWAVNGRFCDALGQNCCL